MSGRGRSALVILATLLSFGGRCGTEPTEVRLSFEDEFDGPAGESPDPAKWAFDKGTDWGNAQLEYDTDRPENVSLDGEGHLAITAREESYGGQPYTSGRIKTQGLFERAHGRFEARIKLPSGRGLWPAFWLLGADIQTAGWPVCGEIDVMEYRGQEPAVAHGSLHGPGYSGGSALTSTYVLPEGGFDDDYHVFAIEWDEDGITWYIDDDAYQTITPGDLPGGKAWVFDDPFFILLNVAVGGNYVGSPDSSTVFPQTMYVDWVRAYGSDS